MTDKQEPIYRITHACLANAGRSLIGEAVTRYAMGGEAYKPGMTPIGPEELDKFFYIRSGGINVPKLLAATVPWPIFGKQFRAACKLGVDGSDNPLVRKLAKEYSENGPEAFTMHMEDSGVAYQTHVRHLFQKVRANVHRTLYEVGKEALRRAHIPEEFLPTTYNQPLNPGNPVDIILLADKEDIGKVRQLYNSTEHGRSTSVDVVEADAEHFRVNTVSKKEVIAPWIQPYMESAGFPDRNIPDDPAGGLEKAMETVEAYMDTRAAFRDNLRSWALIKAFTFDE